MDRRKGRRALCAASAVAATTAAMLIGGTVPASGATDPTLDGGLLRTVHRDAVLSFPSGQVTGTPAGIQSPEFPPTETEDGETSGAGTDEGGGGGDPVSPAGVPVVDPTPVAGAAGPARSFEGLDSFDQRYANNGNQYSVEPPDQALCVGNGMVLEGVNTVLRVYRTSGEATSAVTDLNTFFGYPAQIDRSTEPPTPGPFLTDPTCLFDTGTQRWFVTVLTIEVDPATGDFTGPNHIDTAVSTTADPLGEYHVYRLPVQDDGTQGTPEHPGCPCIGDYPHIATDAYGFFITTNEYPFSDDPGVFGNNYNGAQVYALDKAALVAGAEEANVVQFDDTALAQGSEQVPGFTLAPAKRPDTSASGAQSGAKPADDGTEYFLSSVAAEEAQPEAFTGQAAALGVYALRNTASLGAEHPELSLEGALRPSQRYVNPPLAEQAYGPTPLADFCSVTDCFGFGVAQYAEGPIATNDSRMHQVYLADGRLYGALDTGVQLAGQLQAGIAWFLVDPERSPEDSRVRDQGYLAVTGQHVAFPAIAAREDGVGAMAFTLTGPDHFPSAAYSLVTPHGLTGPVRVAAAGAGPQDGFTEYLPVGDPGSAPRPRWGDYGAAVPVGSAIWLASEYIGQSCSFAEYQQDPTCGNTRGPFTNWATRISAVTP